MSAIRRGETHPNAKLRAQDVKRLRRLAASGRLPRGWLVREAARYGVHAVALSHAISGTTWRHITTPAPVPPWARHGWKTLGGSRRRRQCPTCRHPKYDRRGCPDVFHTIDHRHETSAINAQKAQAASVRATLNKRRSP